MSFKKVSHRYPPEENPKDLGKAVQKKGDLALSLILNKRLKIEIKTIMCIR